MSKQWVLDASALLAVLNNESGSEMVEKSIREGAVIGAVNMSEVIAKLNEIGIPDQEIIKLSNNIGIEVIRFDHNLAYTSGLLRIKTKQYGLSLGDRACLALAKKLGLPCLTADKIWERLDLPIEIQLIR